LARPPRPGRPRFPGTFLSGEARPLDADPGPQRLVLYLPGSALDEAERQSIRAGAKDIQSYCEEVLIRHLDAEQARCRLLRVESRRGELEGVRAVASDPDYLSELTLNHLDPPAPAAQRQPEPEAVAIDSPVDVVGRHAGLSDGASPFLDAILRGGPAGPEVVAELLAALGSLESDLRPDDALPRRLAFALHRLSLAGQIVASEAWSASGLDPGALAGLRRVQEAVDRVLSGQDIRYDAGGGEAVPGESA
jgi:hypothetical protein